MTGDWLAFVQAGAWRSCHVLPLQCGMPAPLHPFLPAHAPLSPPFLSLQVKGALAACQGSVERAADWLFSRGDDLDAAVEAALAPPSAAGKCALVHSST